MTKIINFTVDDVRFPTSKDLTGSDAIHTDPDYSATYVTVYTSDNNLKGFGIAFTIGKGNDIVAECIKHFFPLFIGKTIDELERDIGKLWFQCVDHSQLRWLGPEKGVVHMAVAAIFNSLWDLIAKKNVKSDDIIVSENSRTNYKMRLIADGQHIVRADWNNNKINEKQEFTYPN